MRLKHFLTVALCAILLPVCFGQTKCWDKPAPSDSVPSNGIDKLFITGYQGWFAAAGDNSPIDRDPQQEQLFSSVASVQGQLHSINSWRGYVARHERVPDDISAHRPKQQYSKARKQPDRNRFL